ncbi:MAG: type II toxin-antitoxin system PemK/MazF family toxin [Nitratireductor sp.]|nr:type II toxin-antitoxin system PemK/MazF family toxin [Nitratireductor sp.]
MGIQFFPRAGQVLVCDFRGFEAPEMIKRRPVIIISPRLPNRGEIVTVVPISTTEPLRELPFTVRLSKNYHPDEDDGLACWAKCDMLMNLSIQRLDGFKVGRRRWQYPQLTGDDLQAVRRGVLFGLGMGDLSPD